MSTGYDDEDSTLRLRIVYEASQVVKDAIADIRKLKEETGALTKEQEQTLIKLEAQRTLLEGRGFRPRPLYPACQRGSHRPEADAQGAGGDQPGRGVVKHRGDGGGRRRGLGRVPQAVQRDHEGRAGRHGTGQWQRAGESGADAGIGPHDSGRARRARHGDRGAGDRARRRSSPRSPSSSRNGRRARASSTRLRPRSAISIKRRRWSTASGP